MIMPRPKKLTGPAADLLLTLAKEGKTHREIAAALAERGVEVDFRTVGRSLARHGLARRPSAPARARGEASDRNLGGPRVAAAHLDAPTGQPGGSIAVGEVAVLEDLLRRLRAELDKPIASTDKARVSSEIRAVLVRMDDLAMRRRASALSSETDGAASRVRERLERLMARRQHAELVKPAADEGEEKGGIRASCR